MDLFLLLPPFYTTINNEYDVIAGKTYQNKKYVNIRRCCMIANET